MTDYHFKDFTNSINQFGNEEFITVHKYLKADLLEGSLREVISAVLIPNSEVKKEAKKAQWICNPIGLKPGVIRYADAPDKYKRWGIEGRLEPIVYQQFFNKLIPEQYRVVEEFILLFNLYEDKNAGRYKGVDIQSDTTVVIKFSENEISIRKHELRKFLSLKKMTLFLQFEYFFFSVHDLAHHGVTRQQYSEVITPDYQWMINYQQATFASETSWRSNARLQGKKALYGYANYQEPDVFDRARSKRKYVDFIVNVQEDGEPKELSSDLEKLSEVMQKRFAYSPVFFKSEVLEKYYKNPELYSIEDGVIIKKGSWTLEIDNDHAGHVAVYLTDLAKLNYEEQCYWRSYNIIPVDSLSEVKFRRDFLVDRHAEPSASDLLFRKYFQEFSVKFFKRYGYDLFLPLRAGDEYFFKNIRRPLNEDSHEFDQIIICLSKSLNDSINVNELKKQFVDEPYAINQLQKFLEREFGKDYDVPLILRAIQEFRSKGVAHRKGSDYQKLFKKLNVADKTKLAIIDGYLAKLAIGFRTLAQVLSDSPAGR
ncbi:hypothetical protein ACFGVS_13670 [Mucilaginibacter sp. AW1-7]|jgi:hypothetical protein|uniref:hypothetical protein n=1 Tax=Mucilaginibacter sp. AW1-7 TaxID=3349874 RepID=UPI003F734361